jgi:hypothetical protein
MKPQIIVSHTDDNQLFVWNTEKQPNRAGEGAKVSWAWHGADKLAPGDSHVIPGHTYCLVPGRPSGCADSTDEGAGGVWSSLCACTHPPSQCACLFVQAVVTGLDPLLPPLAPLLQKDAAESVPDLVLSGHKDIAAFALATTSAAPLVASGGSDNLVSAAGRGGPAALHLLGRCSAGGTAVHMCLQEPQDCLPTLDQHCAHAWHA